MRHDAGPRGLCHVHDPDADYALQHPAMRAALLQRSDIRSVLGLDEEVGQIELFASSEGD